MKGKLKFSFNWKIYLAIKMGGWSWEWEAIQDSLAVLISNSTLKAF